MHTADWHLQEAEDVLRVGSSFDNIHQAELLKARAQLASAHIALATTMIMKDQMRLANDQLSRANRLLEDQQ